MFMTVAVYLSHFRSSCLSKRKLLIADSKNMLKKKEIRRGENYKLYIREYNGKSYFLLCYHILDTYTYVVTL